MSEDASDSEVKAAYLHLAKKFHPDVQHTPELADLGGKLETVFVRLGQAYRKARDQRCARRLRGASAGPPCRRRRMRRPSTNGPKAPGAPEHAAKQDEQQQPVMPEEVYRKAEDAYDEGKYWEAMALLGVAIQGSSGVLQRRARLLLIRAYLKYPDRVRDAEKELLALIERDPENAETQYLLGTIYLAQRPENARRLSVPACAGAATEARRSTRGPRGPGVQEER